MDLNVLGIRIYVIYGFNLYLSNGKLIEWTKNALHFGGTLSIVHISAAYVDVHVCVCEPIPLFLLHSPLMDC